MRKYTFVALVALCLAVPGMSVAEPVMTSQTEMVSGEMDPALVEAILKRAAEECPFDFCDLQQMYDDGTLWIEKVAVGYWVTDGGVLIDIILDDL